MTPIPDFTRGSKRIGICLVLAVAIAACGGAAASSQPSPAGDSAAPTTSSAEAQTDAAASSPSSAPTPAESVVVPSLGAGTPLVDILPTELGGAPMQKVALVASDLSVLDPATAMVFDSVLEVLGKEGADMTIGAASNADASVIAIRVSGKSAKEIGDAMIAGRALNATTTKDELDLGGKHVIKVTTTTATVPFYVYAVSDVSFTIAGSNETIVAEALSKLP